MKRGITVAVGTLLLCAILSGCNEPPSPQQQDSRMVDSELAAGKAPQTDGADDRLPPIREAEGQPNLSASVADAPAKFVTPPLEPSPGPVEQPQKPLPPAELVERAQNGDAPAQRELGKFFADKGELRRSVQWYWEAASRGDAEAQRTLGIAYIFGQGLDRNMEEAGNWLLAAAKQGDTVAQRELGKVYGEQWKFEESNEWLLQAASKGDAEAQRLLGLRYTIGQGVDSNRDEALKWFLLAGQQGDAVAQRELGKFYGEQWNLKESNEWYLKAAMNGDVRAQHMMGVRYTFGQGVERDIAAAGQWFLLAAEQGDAQSQYSIGLRWLRGEAGEPRDFAEAAKWFHLAAEQGLDDAQLTLGRRYANGEGVTQNHVEAYKWIQLARDQGKVQGAEKILNDLAANMTPEQIAEAQAKAKGFLPTPAAPLNLTQ